MSVILFVFEQFDFMFLCQGNGLFVTGYLIEVYTAVFLNGINHGNSLERSLKRDLLALIGDVGCAKYIPGNGLKHSFSHVHHAVHVGVGNIEFNCGEFRVMHRVHSFISEQTADFIDTFKSADDQSL